MEEVSRSKLGLGGGGRVVDARFKVAKKKDEISFETKNKGRGRSEVLRIKRLDSWPEKTLLVHILLVLINPMELQLEGWAALLLPLAKVEARQETQLWQQQPGRQ